MSTSRKGRAQSMEAEKSRSGGCSAEAHGSDKNKRYFEDKAPEKVNKKSQHRNLVQSVYMTKIHHTSVT